MSAEYFQNFPQVVDSNGDRITNICLRFNFFESIKNNATLFEMLQINDGERPEDIAT